MPVNRIEALVDAIAHLKGFSNPDSDLYQIRSPLGIQSFSRPGKNEIDVRGRRIFSSALAGYRAAEFDVRLKCSGESRAGIKKDDLLENLLRVLGITESLGQQQVVKFLKRALREQNISSKTPLSWFVEETAAKIPQPAKPYRPLETTTPLLRTVRNHQASSGYPRK